MVKSHPCYAQNESLTGPQSTHTSSTREMDHLCVWIVTTPSYSKLEGIKSITLRTSIQSSADSPLPKATNTGDANWKFTMLCANSPASPTWVWNFPLNSFALTSARASKACRSPSKCKSVRLRLSGFSSALSSITARVCMFSGYFSGRLSWIIHVTHRRFGKNGFTHCISAACITGWADWTL